MSESTKIIIRKGDALLLDGKPVTFTGKYPYGIFVSVKPSESVVDLESSIRVAIEEAKKQVPHGSAVIMELDRPRSGSSVYSPTNPNLHRQSPDNEFYLFSCSVYAQPHFVIK